jgi:ketosteroid isomerase-like protein
MELAELQAIEGPLIDAWNAHDVEAVVACYSDDVVYVDPNTRAAVEGSDAMRRYLTKLFARWEMHWTVKELFPFADRDGSAALWRASLTARSSGESVGVDGMDLILIEGGKVSRNEVYFDRAVLAPLVVPQEAGTP